MSALPNQISIEAEHEREARLELIAALEALQPQSQLGAELRSLRLQMLRAGQHLATLDEINQELGREENTNLH
jgi:hypothetical protein